MTARNVKSDSSSGAVVLAEELRRAIGTFVRAIREKTDTEKSAQPETLSLLDREGAMNVAALAQRRSVTHQTMRVVVAQLVAEGWVERSPDLADRRSWLVSLTDTGRAQVARDRDARASRIGMLIETTLSVAEQKHLHRSIGFLDRISATAKD